MSTRRPAIALMILALLAGCGGKDPVASAPTTAPPETAIAPTPSASPTEGCRVYLPATVGRSLRTQWARPRPGHVVPFTSAGKGPWIAAQVSSATFDGVALVNLETDEVREIDRFEDSDLPTEGSYDGSAVVWVERHSDYVIKAWDERSGRVRVVSRWDDDPRARPGTTTATTPVVAGGRAAWIESRLGRGGRLVVLDLGSGRTRVIATGRLSAPLIHEGQLVWREGRPAEGPFTTHAIDLADGRVVDPPAALAARTGWIAPLSDGPAIAWLERPPGAPGQVDQEELFWSADGHEPGRRIARFAVGGFSLAMRDGVVVTAYSDGLMAVDAEGTSATAALGGGSVTLGAGGFVIAAPNVQKSLTPPDGLAVVKAGELDLPPCG